jgi:hypothetical protein
MPQAIWKAPCAQPVIATEALDDRERTVRQLPLASTFTAP